MELKERILEYMRHEDYKPLDESDLAEKMKLTQEELIAFSTMVEEMEDDAVIVKNSNDLYGVPEHMSLVVGRLSMTGKGFGFIIPDVREKETDTDVFVPGTMLDSAMNNDRVVARVSPSEMPGRSREGEIIRIVKRANTKIVGTFESSKTFGFVTPDDMKLNQDVFIPKKYFNGAKVGTKVVVEITKWPDGRRSAEGRIIEIIGMVGAPGVDILSVMRQYDLSTEFPPEVQEAADATELSVSLEEYRGRRDRRDFHIVTIDGDDAKDLDDGVYVEKRENGGFFLGVYIADVSWYVRENAPLDKEARERGTSVYLVDRVIPMLPTRLSNGICSLNAGEDRLAMACEMEISSAGQVISYEILPTVIHVYRRLTYNIVNKVLVDKEQQFVDDNADILTMLQNMADMRKALKQRRHVRGSIDFDLPEVKVRLDSEGKPIALIKRVGSLAESMIEECMLVANETVAEHMDKKNLPFVYRVHEQPTSDKIDRLNDLLAAFSLHINKNSEDDNIKPMMLQKILEQVAGKPEERIISSVSLRSMQQARYSTESLGHFGLAARYYTHFTSPIRRYPDLMVHRLLRETFQTGTIEAPRQERLRGMLPEIATHASQRERVAIEAERETTDMKKIEYMAQFVGDEFAGIVSGVTAFGVFVELDNGVEGLVHVSSMVNDYYEYVEAQYSLIGQRTHQAYRLGDEVQVVLARASIEERNIDFIFKDNGVYTPLSDRKPKPEVSKPACEKSIDKPKAGTGKGRNRKRGSGKKNSENKSDDKIVIGVVKPLELKTIDKTLPEKPKMAKRLPGAPMKEYKVRKSPGAIWPDPKPKKYGEFTGGAVGKNNVRPHRRTTGGTTKNK
ncbi:MAG: ribonuclease R [Selenomonadaceae bacterium]